ncbi:MAG: general secretion pathway protein H [Hyphomicrobiaceae bacterium]|jgi:general secretion pathway protein H
MSQAGRQPSHTNRNRRNAQSGFTLIEVLVVFVILGVVIAAIGMWTRPSAGGTELKAAAAHIASTLRDARTRAILQQADRLVLVDVDRRLVWSGLKTRATRLGQGIRIAVTSAQSQSEARPNKVAGIRFYPNGSSSGATIRLYGTGQTHELRVNWLTGRVSQKSVPIR